MRRRTTSQSGNKWPLSRCAAQTSLIVCKVGDKLPVKSSSLKLVVLLACNLLDLVWSLHFFLLFWHSSLAAFSLPAVIPSYDGSWGPPLRRVPLQCPIVSLFLELAYSILFASSSNSKGDQIHCQNNWISLLEVPVYRLQGSSRRHHQKTPLVCSPHLGLCHQPQMTHHRCCLHFFGQVILFIVFASMTISGCFSITDHINW